MCGGVFVSINCPHTLSYSEIEDGDVRTGVFAVKVGVTLCYSMLCFSSGYHVKKTFLCY